MTDKRTKGAVATLVVGLVLNIALGATKLIVGILSGSVSVSSDAANNLSDAAVSLVSIIAVSLSARAADHDHPYGHGRYEYIATFVLGAVILAVGFEIFRGGVDRAINPVPVAFDTGVWVALAVSIAVKSFMAVFYFVRGKKQRSDTVKAAAVDSVSDAAVTTVVLVCAIVERYTGLFIDGYASIAVSAVVIVFAVRILRQIVSRLLGERPDPELEQKLYDIVSSVPEVISAHDLIINDYGEQNKIAEIDAVFPADMSFVDVHAACDGMERRAAFELGVRLSVHADPHIADDERLTSLTERIAAAIGRFGATTHDLSVDDERKVVELDIRLPNDGAPESEIKALVAAEIRGFLPEYDAVINTDFI